MMEEGHSDLISFQPTDSDLPSFLEDCNRVRQQGLHPRPLEVAHGRERRVPGPWSLTLRPWASLLFLQAKLPRGIHQVRPHLQNIDNVPLLVPLFTDCTPESEYCGHSASGSLFPSTEADKAWDPVSS